MEWKEEYTLKYDDLIQADVAHFDHSLLNNSEVI